MARRLEWPALVLTCAAACSCREPAEVTPPVPVTPIAACPDGAGLTGEAPPAGLRQRCQNGDSVRHGASRDWYSNRRERAYTEWWEGEKHGAFRLWYESGRVRSEGFHRHGVPAGVWTYYREDGTVVQQQTFPAQPPPADWLAQAIAGRPPVRTAADPVAPGAADAGVPAAPEPGRVAEQRGDSPAPAPEHAD